MQPAAPRVEFRWPGFATGAVTSSWDDGTVHDRRLVGLFQSSGIRGSFYLNSGSLAGTVEPRGHVAAKEVATLYRDMEVGSHSVTHPHLWRLGEEFVFAEMLEDRRRLEELCGHVIAGFVFPFGQGDNSGRLQRLARRAGYRYARASHLDGRLAPPESFLEWAVTCHCGASLHEHWERFAGSAHPDRLFYVWGHSYEFEETLGWAHIERWVADASTLGGLWFATNREVCDYVEAWRGLDWSLDRALVSNRSGTSVFFSCNGQQQCVPAGGRLDLRHPRES